MDAARAQDFARRLGIDDVGRPVALRPGLGGNDLWRLRRDRHGAGDLVLRVFPAGSDDARVERETAAHALATAHGVRTPRIVGSGRIGGRPVLAMEWVDGPLVSEALWGGQDPDLLGRRCGELLARLHRIDAGDVARSGQAIGERDWIDWAGRRSVELRPALERFDDHRLLHLDFHPENLLLVGDDIVVLDWANTRLGPAAADLARTASIVDLIRDGHPDIGERERTAVIAFGDGLLAGYASATLINWAAGEPAVPAAIEAWAAAVQLVDVTASWVSAAYLARLERRYRDTLPNRP